MSEQLTSNKFENDDLNSNSEEDDYKNLLNRLKKISANIVLLEKTIFREF